MEPTWATCVDGTLAGNVATLGCVPVVFKQIINWALAFSGTVALLFVLYAGVRYITSRGDPKAVEGAKNTLTWAIVGLAVIILAYMMINFVAFFTGASCILEFGFENCPIP